MIFLFSRLVFLWVPCKVFDAPKEYGGEVFSLATFTFDIVSRCKANILNMKMVAPPQKQNPPPRGPDFEVPAVSLFGGDMIQPPWFRHLRRMSWKIRFHRFSLDSMEIILGLNRFFPGGSHGGPFRVKSPWRIKILASFIAFNFQLCFFDSIDLKGKFKTLFF